MRLLFVSNLFPPHHIGGYELVCERTAGGLRERGHEVHVLTSSFGSGPQQETLVARSLICAYRPPDYFPDADPTDTRVNAEILAAEIGRIQPDLVVLWNLHGLGMHQLYRTALQESRHVATRLGDYQFWPDWDPARPIPPEGLSVLLHPRLRCAANCRTLGGDLARVGANPSQIAILRSSVESPWADLPTQPSPPPPFRLLWAGRIGTHKGLSVATEAATMLARNHRISTRLDIVGHGDKDLLSSCLSRAAKAAVDGSTDLEVRYLGPANHAQLAELFPQYHAYLAPSVGHEALPMTCIEAMAAGTPVVASRLGGLVEITGGGQRGLLFDPGDAEGLSTQLRRLYAEPRLLNELRTRGHRYVRTHYSRETTLDNFEVFATECARGQKVAAMPPSVPKLSDPERSDAGPLATLAHAARRLLLRRRPRYDSPG